MREKASIVAETIEKNNIDWVDEIEAFGNEIRLITIAECSEIVSTTRDRGDACRKLLNLALSQSEENKG